MRTDPRKHLRRRMLFPVLALPIVLAGCSAASSGDTAASAVPTAPSTLTSSSRSARPLSDVTALEASSQGLELRPVVGSGAGIVNFTPTAVDEGRFTFSAQVSLNVHGLLPNQLLYAQASNDIGLGGQQADGICQRAVAGIFVPLRRPTGEPVTLQVPEGGAGATHFELLRPTPDGTRFDAMIRLVDALPPAIPSIELRTTCFAGEVK